MRPGLDRASPDGLLEEGYLLVAADHRRLDADGGAPTTPTRRHGHRSPGGHGKGLAFEWQCQQLLVLDELSRQRMSDRAHQHAAWRRCLLQARRSVDSVASDHAVALDADAPEVDEHLAGLHADPQPELGPALRRELEPEVSHCRLHLEGGSHGAFGVVLVDGRHAEDGQHGIAGELLDRALVPVASAERRSNARLTKAWTSSGSVVSLRLVKPTRSANRMVATLRSRPDPVAPASAEGDASSAGEPSPTVWPHDGQNLAPVGRVAPHAEQEACVGVPHAGQKRVPWSRA